MNLINAFWQKVAAWQGLPDKWGLAGVLTTWHVQYAHVLDTVGSLLCGAVFVT